MSPVFRARRDVRQAFERERSQASDKDGNVQVHEDWS